MTVLLGSNSLPATGSDGSAAGFLVATRVVAAATGIVDTITVAIDSTNTYTQTVAVGVYDSTGTSGGPGARLGNVATFTISGNGTTRFVKSSAGIGASVTSGSVYWIATVGTASGSPIWQWSNSSGNNGAGGNANHLAFESVGGFTTLPSTFPAFTFAAEDINTYAEDTGSVPLTVTAVGGTATAVGGAAAAGQPGTRLTLAIGP